MKMGRVNNGAQVEEVPDLPAIVTNVEVGGVPKSAAGAPQGLHRSVGELSLDDAVNGEASRWVFDFVHLPHLRMPAVKEGEDDPAMGVVGRQRIMAQPNERPRSRRRECKVLIDVCGTHPKLHDVGGWEW